jgi:SAM-dependent methyltransferase
MVRTLPNKQYNLAAPNSLPVRIAGHQRRTMYDRFIIETGIGEQDTVLDVGATADRSYKSSNYLEAWYPHKATVTAVGIDDASFLVQLYPGIRFLRANGLELPFSNLTFDIVHSSAVLEHVGSLKNQVKFVQECCRVARKSIFMTTPNRWFPMEFHTILPLVHWLPKPVFRQVMRSTGRDFFADESNLNLLDARNLASITRYVEDFTFRISSVSLWYWPSNLLLIGKRRRVKLVPEAPVFQHVASS